VHLGWEWVGGIIGDPRPATSHRVWGSVRQYGGHDRKKKIRAGRPAEQDPL